MSEGNISAAVADQENALVAPEESASDRQEAPSAASETQHVLSQKHIETHRSTGAASVVQSVGQSGAPSEAPAETGRQSEVDSIHKEDEPLIEEQAPVDPEVKCSLPASALNEASVDMEAPEISVEKLAESKDEDELFQSVASTKQVRTQSQERFESLDAKIKAQVREDKLKRQYQSG